MEDSEEEKPSGRCVWLFGSFGGCTVSKEEGRGRLGCLGRVEQGGAVKADSQAESEEGSSQAVARASKGTQRGTYRSTYRGAHRGREAIAKACRKARKEHIERHT